MRLIDGVHTEIQKTLDSLLVEESKQMMNGLHDQTELVNFVKLQYPSQIKIPKQIVASLSFQELFIALSSLGFSNYVDTEAIRKAQYEDIGLINDGAHPTINMDSGKKLLSTYNFADKSNVIWYIRPKNFVMKDLTKAFFLNYYAFGQSWIGVYDMSNFYARQLYQLSQAERT